jgi:hypothetical protein
VNQAMNIKFTVGGVEYRGTAKRVRHYDEEIIFKIIFHDARFPDNRYVGVFSRENRAERISRLPIWHCQYKNFEQLFESPICHAIESQLKENNLSLF